MAGEPMRSADTDRGRPWPGRHHRVVGDPVGQRAAVDASRPGAEGLVGDHRGHEGPGPPQRGVDAQDVDLPGRGDQAVVVGRPVELGRPPPAAGGRGQHHAPGRPGLGGQVEAEDPHAATVGRSRRHRSGDGVGQRSDRASGSGRGQGVGPRSGRVGPRPVGSGRVGIGSASGRGQAGSASGRHRVGIGSASGRGQAGSASGRRQAGSASGRGQAGSASGRRQAGSASGRASGRVGIGPRSGSVSVGPRPKSVPVGPGSGRGRVGPGSVPVGPGSGRGRASRSRSRSRSEVEV